MAAITYLLTGRKRKFYIDWYTFDLDCLGGCRIDSELEWTISESKNYIRKNNGCDRSGGMACSI